MINFLYTICIFPIVQILELAYVFFIKIFDNPAIAVIGLSFTVSILTLPLYLMAEKKQQAERDIQNKLKPKIKKIKAVFPKDEAFILLQTYYRQNNYHPIYSLKSSLGIMIQIPFFIAAFNFISNLAVLNGYSLGPISNLSNPDSLFTAGGITINILPILMTLINIISSAIYSKGHPIKDKVQIYGMAVIFLFLLYNSPSGLVLYWTFNNIFSLGKNIILKSKKPKFVTMCLTIIFCTIFIIYLLFVNNGLIIKRIALAVFMAIIPVTPFIIKYLKNVFIKLNLNKSSKYDTGIFIFSLISIFLLAGFVTPSFLISSSVQEFSNFDDYKNPIYFIGITLLQSFGLLILLPICIYFLTPSGLRKIFVYLAVIIAVITIINTFIFPGNYGNLDLDFNLSKNILSSKSDMIINFIVLLISVITILFLTYQFKLIISSFFIIIASSLAIVGSINCFTIQKEYSDFKSQLELTDTTSTKEELTKVYKFSKTGNNILVIMLDMAVNGYVPYILEEKPSLYDIFDGFTYYKNTISFAPATISGTPSLFGGYEYVPLEIQKRDTVSLREKHNEALLLLPKILMENDFNVAITDPSYANYSYVPDLSIFKDYPEITSDNIIGKYTNKWIIENEYPTLSINDNINKYLIRFSYFKFIPLAFRNFVYNHGNWLTVNNKLSRNMLDNYSTLNYMPQLTEIIEDNINTYNVIVNELPHIQSFLQAPCYIPMNDVTNKGTSPFRHNRQYHVNIASLLLLGKWFEYLKENDVYDNTRIIIVSDHGAPRDWSNNEKILDEFLLPNESHIFLQLHALLLSKDFGSNGRLHQDNTFMTNADVPLLVLKDIVENPINPWTGNPIESNKENGVIVTTSEQWISNHLGNTFNIKPDEWLHVKDNIHNPANWSMAVID